MSKSKKKLKNAESSAEPLDSSMDVMEETRFRKKHQDLIQSLTDNLHFTYREVECVLLIYYKLQKLSKNPSKGVDKTQFRDVLHCAMDMTDDYLMDRTFYSLDKGPSPFMTMECWTNTLSLLLRGTLEEKINFCFSVYDTMGDGILARETLFNLMKPSFISPISEEDAEETAKDLVEVVSKKLDLDRDGKVSFNDYKTSVIKNPMLLEVFGQCLPSRPNIYAFESTYVPKISKM